LKLVDEHQSPDGTHGYSVEVLNALGGHHPSDRPA
jgi:hypothetical protein